MWATAGVVVRKLYESSGLGPVATGFHRLLIAAILLLALSGPILRQAVRGLRSHPWSLISAVVGLGVYQVRYFIAVTDVGVGVSTVVSLGVALVITTVIEAVTTRQRPTVRTVVITTAAVAGLAPVAVGSAGAATASAPRPAIGLRAAVGSGVGYALTTIVSRHAAKAISPLAMTTTSSMIGAVTLLPMALLSGAGLPSPEPRSANSSILVRPPRCWRTRCSTPACGRRPAAWPRCSPCWSR